MSFTHLHSHSSYSLLDGLSPVKAMASRAREMGQPAIALTDHGVLFGAIDFYESCHAQEIKPIIGLEAYISQGPMGERAGNNYHLTLLAMNLEGYKNLIRITTDAHLHGFYRKPRVDKQYLQDNNSGLICLSGCAASELSTYITNDQYDDAHELVDWYKGVFGDRFYLEVQDHGLEFDSKLIQASISLASEHGVRLVATNDSHYITREQAIPHEIMLCVQTQDTMSNPDRMNYGAHEFYLKSYDEMRGLFGDVPGALSNTLEIAERCNLEIPMDRLELPCPPIPVGETPITHLKRLTWEGIKAKYGPTNQEAIDRARYELGVIENAGYAKYFLLVQDMLRFARENRIPSGVRGSTGGCLVAYCIGITSVDPLEYGLPFERFLNPDRVSMPDCDVDVADVHRDKIIRYMRETYGEGNVAQIITFGTIKARMAIRDVGRAMDLPLTTVDRLAKLIPFKNADQSNVTVSQALQNIPELQLEYRRNKDVRQLIDTCVTLEGMHRHASTHAAGIVVSQEPLINNVPLYTVPKLDGAVATQYTMESLEKIGLLKMDVLGLRTLSIMQEVADTVGIDLEEIPLDDPGIYELLGTGQTFGIFQVESPQMMRLMRSDKPQTVQEVSNIIALYRPTGLPFIEDYVKRHKGLEEPVYPHPLTKPILGETFGIFVFQEQITKLVQEVGGFTPGQADLIRKAIGKKKIAEMRTYKENFLSGAKAKGVSPSDTEALWDIIDRSSGYGFNMCAWSQTNVTLPDGTKMTLSQAYSKGVTEIMSMWPDGVIRPHKVSKIVSTGDKPLYKVTTKSGKKIVITKEHRLLTTQGYMPLSEMKVGTELIVKRRGCNDNQRAARRQTIRATYDTGPGFGKCSIASNGMWCASQHERNMCEYLISLGIKFETHKVLKNGRVCDFYFGGLYWEMDGMDRAYQYFADKYEDLPFIVVTPEDYTYKINNHLNLDHAENGDPIISIEYFGVKPTYDIEMMPDGPLNWIANEIVSHNSHSTQYAIITCKTAYLKHHYPTQYMVSLLSAERGDQDKVAEAIVECRRLGVEVLLPSINKSEPGFTIEDGAIRYGLSAIKGIGDAVAETIASYRPYNSVQDFINKNNTKVVNKRVIDALAQSGAFDEFGERATFARNSDTIIKYAQDRNKWKKSGQLSLFGNDFAPLILPSVVESTRTDRLGWERETLGSYISENILQIASQKVADVIPIMELSAEMEGCSTYVGGVVTDVCPIRTKAKNELMARVRLTDLTGTITVVIFPRQYATNSNIDKDQILIVHGKVQVWEDNVELVANQITTIDIDDEKEPDMTVFITMEPSGDRTRDNMTYMRVCNVLKQFPGNDEVVFRADDGFNKRVLPLSHNRVLWDSRLEEQLLNVDTELKVVVQ